MNQDSEKQERLQRKMMVAFEHTIDKIVKVLRERHDLTTLGFRIAYNKKLDHIEVLKVVSVNNKKVVLEPPVWISEHKYHPLKYSSKDTKDRVTILEIPSQIPDMNKQLEKIQIFSKS